MNRLYLYTVALLTPLVLGACVDGRNPAAAARSDEQIRIENEQNQRQLEALIAEIDPHVRYGPDGSWSIASDAPLSPTASEFAFQAQAAFAAATRSTGQPTARGGLRLAAAPNQSGIQFYWWGARISIRSAAAQEMWQAWRTGGNPAASRVFLRYFGSSAWAAGAAGVVAAHAWTIAYVDRVGGYRGVHMFIPWTLRPVYISPQ